MQAHRLLILLGATPKCAERSAPSRTDLPIGASVAHQPPRQISGRSVLEHVRAEPISRPQIFGGPYRRSGAWLRSVDRERWRDTDVRWISHRRRGAVATAPWSRSDLEARMATTATSTAVAVVDAAFSDPERFALAGYRGLTRDAYTLDLRQFAARCERRRLRLLTCSGRDRVLRPRHRSRRPVPGHRGLPVVHRGRFLPLLGRGRATRPLPGGPCPPTAFGLRVPRTGLDRTEVGTLLVAAGLGLASEPPSYRCWPSTGCGSPKAPAPTSRPWAFSAATGP